MAVIVVRDGKVLLGKRKNAHGNGTWCFPGGHLEFGESWDDCAARETMEEAGISIKNIRFAAATNDIFREKHYVTLFMLADYGSGEVRIMEPEKCGEWGWFTWENLPGPLFLPIQNLLKIGYNPFSV